MSVMRNDIISTLSYYISNDINLCCRFSLTSWFQFGVPVAISPTRQDIDKETSMLEGFFSLILILLSQRVFIGEFLPSSFELSVMIFFCSF